MMKFLNCYHLIYYLFDIMLMLILIMPSNLFKFHPMNYSILLLIFTIILSLKINYLLSNYWYSYIMFLIMVGGVMILIMYLTSISSNEMFYFDKSYYLYLLVKILLFMIIIYVYMKNFYLLYLNKNYELVCLLNMFKDNVFFLKNLYMNMNMEMNIFMMLYLFLMMMSSTLICLKNNIPMRQMTTY